MGWIEKEGKLVSPYLSLEDDDVLQSLGLVVSNS